MAKEKDQFVRVEVFLSQHDADGIRKAHPGSNSLAGAVQAAATSTLSKEEGVRVGEPVLREVASIAGVPRVRSEAELLGAVRAACHMNEHCAVVRLDPAMTPVIYEVARSNKLTLSETVSNYVAHCINAGLFNQWQPLSYINFTPEQYSRLKKEMLTDSRPSGDDLVKFIVAQRMKLEEAQSKSPEIPIPPAPEGDVATL